MACYPHASSEFSVAWLINMSCAGRPTRSLSIRRRPRATQKRIILVATAAGSLAVSQRASDAFAQQDLIYDVGMNNYDDRHINYLRRGFRVVGIEASTCLAKCAAERLRTQISSG
jgi:hypothetical protein